ncbi:MAG: 3-oxoacyl-ACP synthase [Pelatocladus maniniholoensis HA4357-MV3]|jgi:3-oxoacyl-[acyl-carrier-protein] synthase-3|uniref:3-oxoacyl-ACP synthase n=1 Tax=Pelatocladus maniniholoensis HA4357-MV3 TaxID=1117104 RepID=A0A9E3H4W9_9NOST|nr:3-oxoacyl-ACP synthase [Pelatocladus maniniholoensis HA4357-MV3]BAZ70387.1 3-oxoacyl-[acyl-carrier-protein] synthase III [Fischerella sp. NIES-4106]
MVYSPVGIRSLAISLPSIKRTRDYYIEKYPDLVAQSEQKSLAKLFSLSGSTPSNEFDIEMMPYLSDPFRGTVEQRLLGPGESSLTLEYDAAIKALEAAKLSVDDIDLILVASVWPEQIGFGNAAFLAQQLDFQGAAWNLDAACGVTPVALQTACALVRGGEYKKVLVVVSCTYSRFFDEQDTIFWCISDGAGAFVVDTLEQNQGVLGTKTINTRVLCNTLFSTISEDEQGHPLVRMQFSKESSKLFRETVTDFLRTCCEAAASAAGVTLEQIDFFLFNTPTAWFASFCTRVLGIEPERTINIHPQYANIGSVLSLANMYHAAQLGKIHENDLVLIYGFGVAGAASASVMRWGNVALSPDPFRGTDSTVKVSEDSRYVSC